MYNDLKPGQPKSSADVEIINKMLDLISKLTPVDAKNVLAEQLRKMI